MLWGRIPSCPTRGVLRSSFVGQEGILPYAWPTLRLLCIILDRSRGGAVYTVQCCTVAARPIGERERLGSV